ncbi:MAG: copper resistance protein CopC [Aggregatilineales bacterium]
MRRLWSVFAVSVFVIVMCFLNVRPAQAHANLLEAQPTANTVLQSAPQEIRLTFSEALEAQFSQIDLYNAAGDQLETSPAVVDSTDAHVLILALDDLPDGIYTVAWRVVSSVDGHTTQGSFPFSIGVTLDNAFALDGANTALPVGNSLIRMVNLLSLALMVGSVGFWLFVWSPAKFADAPQFVLRMERLMWLGWGFVGVTSVLLLVMQTETITGKSFFNSLDALDTVLFDSRFGRLWVLRVGAWILFGAVLRFVNSRDLSYRLAFVAGLGVLLTQSLYSHAGAAEDAFVAVLVDGLHLSAMAFWVGGLIQFLNILPLVRKDDTAKTGVLVAQFSIYARLGVIVLMLTGIYATWLQVGSVDALINTDYGRALIIKLALILPLLAIAAVNLFMTQRGLTRDEAVWNGRLRKLVSAEIVLTVLILGAVGVMTSIEPARSNYAKISATPESADFSAQATVDDLQIDFTVSPAYTGENTFILRLSTTDGAPVNDASLIRLRFTQPTGDLGESELRPEFIGDGVYQISGANLSLPGDWRIRTTIQRPAEYDAVTDFTPGITAPPPPRLIDPGPSENGRLSAALLVGLGLVALGFLTFPQRRTLASGVLVGGLMICVMGVEPRLAESLAENTANAENITIAETLPDNAPIRLITGGNLPTPMLITAGGDLFQSDGDTWDRVNFVGHVNDLFVETNGGQWLAADNGVYFRDSADDTSWQLVNPAPSKTLISTHGYLYALGAGDMVRIQQGSNALTSEPHLLDVPESDAPSNQFVMLGNHTHVLHNGRDVFLSSDLGLSWQALNAPESVTLISDDPNGNLLAITSTEILRWNWSTATWGNPLPLPEGNSVTDIQIFQNRLYALANGQVYSQVGADWERLDVNEDAQFTDLAQRYPNVLFALDAINLQLWQMTASGTWTVTPINVGAN